VRITNCSKAAVAFYCFKQHHTHSHSATLNDIRSTHAQKVVAVLHDAMLVCSYAQKKRMYVTTHACRQNRSRGQTLSGTKLLLLLAGASSRWSLKPHSQCNNTKPHSSTTAVPSAAVTYIASNVAGTAGFSCAASGNHMQYTGTCSISTVNTTVLQQAKQLVRNLLHNDLADHAGSLVGLAVVAVLAGSVELGGVALSGSVQVVIV
jgi:hypothetical protein